MARAKQGETKAVTDDGPGHDVAARLEGTLRAFSPAPVHLWNPAICGAIDITIDRAGAWRHEGAVIARPALVRLFASVLRREGDGSYVLVTPVEKLVITVEDAPFLAVDLVEDDSADSPTLLFVTNIGEAVRLDAKHPLRVREGGPEAPFVPYVTVKPGLEARLTRSVAEDLAGRAVRRRDVLGVESAGQFFVIGSAGAVGDT